MEYNLTIMSAVEAAKKDYDLGLPPSAKRHDAKESSKWAKWYYQASDDLYNIQPAFTKVNSAEGVSHFLSFHPGLTVSLEGKELTASQAQATLALSKYASSTFDVQLTGDMIVLTEKE